MSVDQAVIANLSESRLARSRFLTLLGGGLVGLAVRVFTPEAARANHNPPPSPCFGYGKCHCCSGGDCCTSTCFWHSDHIHGCPSGFQCWRTCSGGTLYRCCDWHSGDGSGLCICRQNLGSC